MSYDLIKESVPQFTKRVGDRVIAGSNNSIIILGTDRANNGPATINDGLGHIKAEGKGVGTSTVHVICGRKDENPNFSEDKAFVYISSKTDADKNLDTESIEFDSGIQSSVITKADNARIITRSNLKFTADKLYFTMDSSSDSVVLQAKNIRFGTGATHPLVHGDTFRELFNAFVNKYNQFVQVFMAHIHIGNMGSPTSAPTGVPIPNPTFNPLAPPAPANPLMLPSPSSSPPLAQIMPESQLSKVSKTK